MYRVKKRKFGRVIRDFSNVLSIDQIRSNRNKKNRLKTINIIRTLFEFRPIFQF